jgi:hypothetical protein
MIRRISVMAVGAAAMLFVAASPRSAWAEQVDNPLYAAWAKFKPGSTASVKHTMHMEGNGMNMDQTFETTTKLVEVTSEKVTVESSTTMAGTTSTHSQDIAAKIDSTDKKAPKQIGQESATAAGKSYSCKVYDLQLEQNGTLVNAKAWIADEVPGGLVKMQSHITQGQMKITDEAVLSSFEVK